jgi:2-methylaconitate cis-trans-isomerase PrpF
MLLLRGTWMRGGTSKCWLFDAADFDGLGSGGPNGNGPGGGWDRDSVLLAAFGAADPRQLDGVGGATSTTSKAAIVRRASEPGADVEYDFAQIGIGAQRVEWSSNCGNCATGIGLYALQAGIVPARGESTTVRMRNVNTGAVLAATVPTPGGVTPESGSATVPGVNGGGVPVELTFVEPSGSTTGRLLPTGGPLDELVAVADPASSPGAGAPGSGLSPLRAPATLVDSGAPAALLDGSALGWDASGTIGHIADHIPELTLLRRAGALAMGLATERDPVSHAVPKVGLVGPAADYRTSDGRPVSADEYDVSVRMVSMHAPHPSVGLTSAVALAAAAGVRGGVVAGALESGGRPVPPAGSGVLRLGTPAGVVGVRMEHDADGRLRAASLERAARRLAVAELFVPLDAAAPAATPLSSAVPAAATPTSASAG